MQQDQTPLWRRTAVAATDYPGLSGDEEAEVVVVGAGFTGLRAALVLAEAGTRVTVLEAGDIGAGASGRTGGQVNPMLPFNGPDKLRQMVGPDYFRKLTDVSLNSADELFDLIRRYQIDCQARQKGWLRVNHSRKAEEKARKDSASWAAYGGRMRFIEGAELERLSGTQAYRSGVVTERGGAVQPLSLARGLARAATGAGAQIRCNARVTGLRQDKDGWRVETPEGVIRTDWVILATNGYTDGLLDGLDKTIIPITPVQIATDPLPDEVIGSILPHGHTISDSRRIIMYARREPDNRFVFGGHGETDKHGRFVGHEWLMKDVVRIFPQLKDVNWPHRWGGRIAITEDRLPHFHEPAPGLIAGLGYNGRGVAMSHVMGRVLAERVLGADPASLPFPTTEIRGVAYRGLQMLGMGAAIWWMRLQDRIDIALR